MSSGSIAKSRIHHFDVSIRFVFLITTLIHIGQGFALDNGLARTPPMGWNSWNCFAHNIDENKIKEVADAMVSTGLKDAGYIYLNLDDNWMATSRDANGNLRADPTRFPKGMKELGDYIHSKGLKFGIYGDRGTRTCHHLYGGGFGDTQSGSIGREVQDANTFASWGVDYLKYDNCEANGATMRKDYKAMRDALANCGRDIVYSICAWEFQPWMPEVGNLWRTTTDILNHWKKEGSDWSWGILDIIDLNEPLAHYAQPGAWNDPDMLQVGNFGGDRSPNENEYRSHMSLWCIMAAPIIMGNDIRNMNQVTKDILLNKEVIAVNQDSAGIQGTRIKADNGLEVWCKPLGSPEGQKKAVALFNRTGNNQEITVHFSDIGLSGTVTVRDLWAKEDKGEFTDYFTMSIPSHGTGMLKISTEATTGGKTTRRISLNCPCHFSARFSNGNITITPSHGMHTFDVSVYLTNGRMIAHRKAITGTVSIPVTGSTVCILSVNYNGFFNNEIITASK